jgi:phosphoglycolate phosphatase
VLFDLDGTLVQTRVASWQIFRELSAQFGLGVDDQDSYFDLFRDNIFASISSLCRDELAADQVRAAFLARLRADYNPVLVPGMVEVIRRLAGYCTLAVMSSNAMEVLRRVLVGNGVAYCFAHVFGGDVTPQKRVAIRQFLADAGSGYGRRCEVSYDEGNSPVTVEGGNTVLVTDTAGDVREGLAEGIRVVGVAWGMHSVDELTEAGAEFVAIWPQELGSYLLGDSPGEPRGACPLPLPASGAPATNAAAAAGAADVAAAAENETRAVAIRRQRRIASLGAMVPATKAPPGRSDRELLAAVSRILPHR